MKDIHYRVYIVGPESDYIYEELVGVRFDSLNKMKEWVNKYIPSNVSYKIVKVQDIIKHRAKSPSYLS